MKTHSLMDVLENETLLLYKKIKDSDIQTHRNTTEANVFLIEENLKFSFKDIPTQKPTWLLSVNWIYFKRFENEEMAIRYFNEIDKNYTNKNLVEYLCFKTREQITDDSKTA